MSHQHALVGERLDRSQLPLIDISQLWSSKSAARLGVARQLQAACEDKGFFYIKNHGIPQGLIDAVFMHSERFFTQPLEKKLLTDNNLSFCKRGYEALQSQTLEAGAPPDLKEGFQVGIDLPLDDPRVVARAFNRGPNLWPADLPGFQPTMQAYYAALTGVAERLLSGIALSLDVPEDYFSGFAQDNAGMLRLLHYPPQPPNPAPGEKGCGAHTDFGGITLLAQDNVGGLQVWNEACGSWNEAPYVPGTYVVNLGDMIQRWTNDRYRSTVHRVVNTSGRERYSVAFFFSGNPDYVVETIETCLDVDGATKYPPIKVQSHLAEMYRKTRA